MLIYVKLINNIAHRWYIWVAVERTWISKRSTSFLFAIIHSVSNITDIYKHINVWFEFDDFVNLNLPTCHCTIHYIIDGTYSEAHSHRRCGTYITSIL